MAAKVEHAEPGAGRFYRARMKPEGLVRFDVALGETDLAIFAQSDLSDEALSKVGELRGELAEYAAAHEGFIESLVPLRAEEGAPEVVRRMCGAAADWQVGPMAAVAGTFAEMVGEALLAGSREVIVENGGDIFLGVDRAVDIGIFAGEGSPFAGRLNVRVGDGSGIRGVCTSSGRVGHSFSRGAADAVVAFGGSAAYADAAATAICNRVKAAEDVERVVEAERRRGALLGLVVVMGDMVGAFGEMEFV